jgi:hypothetical protein
MAISYNTGSLKSSDITATTSDAGVGQRFLISVTELPN